MTRYFYPMRGVTAAQQYTRIHGCQSGTIHSSCNSMTILFGGIFLHSQTHYHGLFFKMGYISRKPSDGSISAGRNLPQTRTMSSNVAKNQPRTSRWNPSRMPTLSRWRPAKCELPLLKILHQNEVDREIRTGGQVRVLFLKYTQRWHTEMISSV